MTEPLSDEPPPLSPPASGKKWGGFFAPFEHPLFREAWLSNTGIHLGSAIQMTGAGWMMTLLTKDSLLISLVQASTTLPLMLFSIIAGAMADNFHRRTLMLVANGLTLVVSILLVVFTLMGLMTPWWLLAFTFLVGLGGTLHTPSWQTSIGDMMPREQLPAAMIASSVGFNLSRGVGPALGGVIIMLLGVAATFVVNALMYLRLLWTLYRWPNIQEKSELPRERIGRSIYLGGRYVVMSPNIWRILLRAIWYGVGAVPVVALLPMVTRDLLMGGAGTYGVMLGAFGLGGLFGALMSGRLRSALRNESIIRLGFTGTAAGVLLMGSSAQIAMTALALVICGASWVVTLSLLNVSVQLSSPRWVVGRSLAIYYTAIYGGFSAGSWFWGWFTERHSLQEALYWAAAVVFTGTFVGLLHPVPDPLDSSLAPSNHWKEPKLEMRIQPNSGPILIEIEYLIREEDSKEFLEKMEDRRRARIRDGAYHWTLLRDLQRPTVWYVTYQFPTWLEYVRHNKRITEADAMYGNEVLALHQGPEEPRVRRLIERQCTPLTPHHPPRMES